jgi:hypothetical protein
VDLILVAVSDEGLRLVVELDGGALVDLETGEPLEVEGVVLVGVERAGLEA